LKASGDHCTSLRDRTRCVMWAGPLDESERANKDARQSPVQH
jgi:hypothetical protein